MAISSIVGIVPMASVFVDDLYMDFHADDILQQIIRWMLSKVAVRLQPAQMSAMESPMGGGKAWPTLGDTRDPQKKARSLPASPAKPVPLVYSLHRPEIEMPMLDHVLQCYQ